MAISEECEWIAFVQGEPNGALCSMKQDPEALLSIQQGREGQGMRRREHIFHLVLGSWHAMHLGRDMMPHTWQANEISFHDTGASATHR